MILFVSSVPMGENNYYHVDKKKKPKLEEVEQDDMLHYNQYQDPPTGGQDVQLQAWRRQQNQFLQSQRPRHLPQQQYIQHQGPTVRNPQLQALLHRYRLRQHQQTLQLQLQQQQQLRRLLLQQQIPPNVCPFGGGMCAHRKFMMFLHHIKQRPEDNCITFWRAFVAEYFSPRAKQRLCFSQYKGADHMLGTLPQGMWQCNHCGTKSGKGVEATFDVLPRLFEIKFASGFVNELLSLEDPRECRVSSGLIVLKYRKLVQTIEYEQCRVVHEGPFLIIFSQDLKILRWEFCVQRHEEFLPRRLIAPKVNQLLQVVAQQDLQTNSNMVLAARRQLANSMELQPLNDLGYPKKYFRALQTYEVVKSMKALMDFTENHKIGPIEGWKRLSEQTERMRLQRQKMQEMEHLWNSGAMNRSAQAQMDGLTGYNNHHHSSAQAAAALTNNQSMLMRLNAVNNQYSDTSIQEGFSSSQHPTPNSNQGHQRQNLATGGFLSSPQMQQQQQRTLNTFQQTHFPEDATEIPVEFSDDNFNDSDKQGSL
ncbi:probable transcriptional regulator SLK1 isoform X1 [Brassica napus]|uniref:probable transcriptional regulator SLK1 isoform X1 n=2 Tax=Brassica napus TaxID=3708 RepID=UPI000BBE855B|nr:probable transcriptional regulator SLK1 isoform X1 [Brassica napus]